jgi:hypothetical protein
MKKLLPFLLASFLFCSNVKAEENVRLTASYGNLMLENNGNYEKGGIYNRLSLGCAHEYEREVLDGKTKGLEYNLVAAWGGSNFHDEEEDKTVERSVLSFWPAVSYTFDNKDETNFSLGFGVIPFFEIEQIEAGEKHRANYLGGELTAGMHFNLSEVPFEFGGLITYGYLKKINSSKKWMEDKVGFLSLGAKVVY